MSSNEVRLSPEGADPSRFVQEVSAPLYQAKGWMKLLGVLSIIAGILYVFTLWGILICWLPIWLGVLLFKAANHVELAVVQNDGRQMVSALDRLKTFFMIQGILSLLMLIIGGILVLVAGGSLLGLLGSMR